MNDNNILVYVLAISKKDEKKTGYGWIKFVPIDKQYFWNDKVPGAKFELAKIGNNIKTNGVYRVSVKTINPFGMSTFEICDAEYMGSFEEMVEESSIFK